MSSFGKQALLLCRWQLLRTTVRYKNRVNIQRPRAPHYERALALHVSKPILPRTEFLTLQEACQKPAEIAEKENKIINPYEVLLGQELINWFNTSRMVLFFHSNSIKLDQLFQVKVFLKKKSDVFMRAYGNKFVCSTLKGTKYEPLSCLFVAPIVMAFGPEPKVSPAFTIDKRTPQLSLIAGIIDGRLLSRSELLEYSRLPDLQTTRSELVSTLQLAGVKLLQDLNHHQSSLVANLEQYVELKKQNATDE